MELVYDEKTGTWGEKKEPYAVIELETEEDYEHFEAMIKFWNDNHKESEDN